MKYSDRFYRISYIDKKGQQRECMASVSLCMIVRNEEQVLGRCLSCVKDFADEIIIVDTGSNDKTKEIASLFTDQIYDFPWIDEYAVGYDGSGSPSFFFYRERLLRRCERAVWKGRIHEVIEPFGKTVREDILIEHRKIGTGDPDRNLRIFEKMIREKGKIAGLTAREHYYYGKEQYYHKRYKEAAGVFLTYLERSDGWHIDRIDACRHGAFCMYQLGKRDEALSFLLMGLREGIPGPELCCDLGWWFFSGKRYADAEFWYRQALKTGRLAGEEGFIMPEYRGYIPYLQLCVCLDRMGERKKACWYNELAERCHPGTEACRKNREYFARIGMRK